MTTTMFFSAAGRTRFVSMANATQNRFEKCIKRKLYSEGFNNAWGKGAPKYGMMQLNLALWA